jgi:methylase of polypeptide subunit release factors
MTGRWCDFGPLRVGYDDSVLAPRPWTMAQSRHAAALLERAPAGPVLELHCGAGHIGQTAAVWSGRELVQVDDDPAACAWSRRNADRNEVDSEVRCAAVEALDVGDSRFALVLADPPYVPSGDVVRFSDDPPHAIDGGDDGLDGVRAALPVAARLTRPGGYVVMQVRGPGQAHTVSRELAELELEVLGMVASALDRAVLLLTRR